MRAVLIAPHIVGNAAPRRPGWTVGVRVRFLAARYDRELEACVPVVPAGGLALHVQRITSARSRRHLAADLRSLIDRARDGGSPARARIPLRRKQILAEEPLIGEIIQRLNGPARSRGIARLRLLLTDGAGPFYTTGRGSLAAMLRGVLAAL